MKAVPDTPSRRRLLTAAAAYHRASTVLDQRRRTLHQAITAVADGCTVSQAARDAGYTRECVAGLVSKSLPSDDGPASA